MTERNIRFAAAAIVAGALAFAAELAQAQEAAPEATGSSERAAFQQQGLPLGGFRVFPAVRATATYNDNVIYGSPQPLADMIFTVAPTIDAKSQWASNELDAQAFLSSNRYAKYTIENNDSYGVKANGRADLPGVTVSGLGEYAHLVEPEGAPGSLLNSSYYVQYDLATLSGQVRKQFGRIGVAAGGGIASYTYGNFVEGGIAVDQHFRDRDVDTVNARIDYQFSALTTFFVNGSYNNVHYRNQTDGDNLGSHGYSALAGLKYELSDLLRGDTSVGYISQSFDNPIYPNFHGIDYAVDLTYAPTALTSLRLTGKRSLTDSAIQQVAGVLVSQIQLSIEHELLRSLLISANVSYANYDYRGIDLSQNRLGLGAGARYKLSRYLSLALSYDRVSQTATGNFGLPYDSNRVSVSIIAAR